MRVLLWLHLIGASLWLGGLATLAIAVIVASRTLPRAVFQQFVRKVGWTFAGLSALAWLLIGVSGLAMAVTLHWPQLAVTKSELGVGIVLLSAVHVAAARVTSSPSARIASRGLALVIFAATLTVFWLGVQLAT
jgi:uncharacterized membrane protein